MSEIPLGTPGTAEPVILRAIAMPLAQIDPERVFERGQSVYALAYDAEDAPTVSHKIGNISLAYKDMTEIMFHPNGIIFGLDMSINAGNVLIQPGIWSIDNVLYQKNSVTTIPIDARDPTDSRYDVIYADKLGAVHLVSGVLSGTPVEPEIPDETIKVGSILITTTSESLFVPILNFVDTVNNQDVYGVKTWKNRANFQGPVFVTDNTGGTAVTITGNGTALQVNGFTNFNGSVNFDNSQPQFNVPGFTGAANAGFSFYVDPTHNYSLSFDETTNTFGHQLNNSTFKRFLDVDDLTGFPTSANNGVKLNSGVVQLGNTLNQNTLIGSNNSSDTPRNFQVSVADGSNAIYSLALYGDYGEGAQLFADNASFQSRVALSPSSLSIYSQNGNGSLVPITNKGYVNVGPATFEVGAQFIPDPDTGGPNGYVYLKYASGTGIVHKDEIDQKPLSQAVDYSANTTSLSYITKTFADAHYAGSSSVGTVTNVTSADTTLLTVANGSSTPALTVVAAPKLKTARLIQGVSFDGTANINVINGTGFVKATGSTLSYDNSTYLTTSSATATYLPLAGGTLTGPLLLSGDPTNAFHPATKNYVDNIIIGVIWVGVDTDSASNIILIGEQTINGVTTNLSRVFLHGQTNPAENGIWTTALGAWARSSDAATGAQIIKGAVIIEGGSNKGQQWVNTNVSVTVGTTAITYVQSSGLGTYTNGYGLTLTGTAFGLDLTQANSWNALQTFGTNISIGGVTVTGSTGTGKNVFDTSPLLVTPTLGVATATSINKVAFTQPASSATLSIANGATLQQTGAFVLNLTATAASTPTFPAGAGTLAYLAGTNPWTGPQDFSALTTVTASALANTSTVRLNINNTSVATVGAQTQYSPGLNYSGFGWNTSGTPASNQIDARIDLRPVAGASPYGNLTTSFQNNVGGYSDILYQSIKGMAYVSDVSTTINSVYGARGIYDRGYNDSRYIFTSLAGYGIAEATSLEVTQSYNIAYWGDSLTLGTQGNRPSLPNIVQQAIGYNYYNAGVAGETSTQIKTRMLADTAKYNWTTIIWAGQNNHNSTATVLSDIAAMVAALPHTRYLVIGLVHDATYITGSSDHTNINTINSGLSAAYGVRYVDAPALLTAASNGDAFDLADVANGVTPRSQRASYDNGVNYDPLHLGTGQATVGAGAAAKVSSLFNSDKALNLNNIQGISALKNGFDINNASQYKIGGMTAVYMPDQYDYKGTFFIGTVNGSTWGINGPLNMSHTAGTTDGQYNFFGGLGAGVTMTTAKHNVGITPLGFAAITQAQDCTVVGYDSLQDVTTATFITALGSKVGNGIINGSHVIAIGDNITGLASGLSNKFLLGTTSTLTFNVDTGVVPAANLFLRTGDAGGAANLTALSIADINSIAAPVVTNLWTFNRTATASGGFAYGAVISGALSVGANADQVIGLDIRCTYPNSAGIATFTINNAGSAYTNGTYPSVSVTGGSGAGVLATVVVSGGVVTSVTPTTPGHNYKTTDSGMTIAAASIGGTGSGVSLTPATLNFTGTQMIPLRVQTGFGTTPAYFGISNIIGETTVSLHAYTATITTANFFLRSDAVSTVFNAPNAAGSLSFRINNTPFFAIANTGISTFSGAVNLMSTIFKTTLSAINSTATATAAQMATGTITSTSPAPTTITFTTATLLATQLVATQGTSFPLTIDNSAGANTVTLALGTGMTQLAVITGSNVLTVAAGSIGTFIFYFSSGTAAYFSRLA